MNSVHAPAYRAFLSYSSRDRQIGEKFHSAIEAYRIPKSLTGRVTENGPVPRRLTPIFRDRSDASSSGNLQTTLLRALEASSTLIVLCSPTSAASPWVNKEIQYFKSLGRQHRVFAVVLHGRPVEFHATLCVDGAFPPALLVDASGSKCEPLAADIRQPDDDVPGDGFEYAILKTIAGITGVSLTELSQRQQEADRLEKRRARRLAALMTGLAVIATSSAVLAWNRNLDAQQRLNDAVAAATERVIDASEFRAAYGVPQATILEMLERTQDSLKVIRDSSGASNVTRLQEARLYLRLSEAYLLLTDGSTADLLTHENEQLLRLQRAEDLLAEATASPIARYCNTEKLGCSLLRELFLEPSIAQIITEKVRAAELKGAMAMRSGDGERANLHFAEAVELAEAARSKGFVDGHFLSASYQKQADAAYEHDGLLESERLFRKALSVLAPDADARGTRRNTEDDRILFESSVLRMRLADVLAQLGQVNEGLAELEVAMAEAERARLLRPENREYELRHAIILAERADRLWETSGENEEIQLAAYQDILSAEQRLRSLHQSSPDRVDFLMEWIRTLVRRSDFETDFALYHEATTTLEEADRALGYQQFGEIPERTLLKVQILTRRGVLGLLSLENPDAEGADCEEIEAQLGEALELTKLLLADLPKLEPALNELQNVYRVRALGLPSCGRSPGEFIAEVSHAIAIKIELTERAADNPVQLVDLYLLYAARAQLHAQVRQFDLARRDFRDAIRVAEQTLNLLQTDQHPLWMRVSDHLKQLEHSLSKLPS